MILDQYNTTSDSIQANSSTASYYWAQTFKCGIAGFLARVIIKTKYVNVALDHCDLIVEIRTTSGGNPTSTVLATKTILHGDVPQHPDPAAEVNIDFSSMTQLEIGTTYAIVMYPSPQGAAPPDAINQYYMSINSTDVYPDGSYKWSEDQITWYASTKDLYFKTYMIQNTMWNDMICDVRCVEGELNDINQDIRVVSIKEPIRDIHSIIYIAERELKDINCDIRVTEDYTKEYDMNCDIRVLDFEYKDINCDIRTVSAGFPSGALVNIDCDIRVLSRNLYDTNCDIRCKEDPNKIYDMNCDIRVKYGDETGPQPIGLEGFRVYLDGDEITDVEIDSIRYEWTMNETPASSTFRVVRKSDNYNKTLENLTQAITTDLPIEIKFNGNVRWYGYVISLDVNHAGESVVVNCLDKKYKIQEQLYDINYGRKWEFPEQGELVVTGGKSTGTTLTEILDKLVTDGLISSYSGVPTGIIPEYQESEGMPAGTLITELLDITGNYYWNVTPNGVLEIYEAGAGNIKQLPLQLETQHINLYDILDFNLKLNDKSNLITEVEVNMGTESEEMRASFKKVSYCGTVAPAWDRDFDQIYNNWYYSNERLDFVRGLQEFRHFYDKFAEPEKVQEVGRKWSIMGWTTGSFIDDSFKPVVIGFNNYQISGWSWSGEYLTLATPLLYVKESRDYGEDGFYMQYGFKPPVLIGVYYRKEDILIATEPTIFDITWTGIGGSGAKRKITLSQLGIKDPIGWSIYENGVLTPKSEPGYNDTEYATDRANLMLSRMNDPVTEGNIDLTFDAFEYYGLNIGKRINLTQTNETNIYNGNNGFPLDIQSIEFDVKSYKVSLSVNHQRNFKATKNYR